MDVKAVTDMGSINVIGVLYGKTVKSEVVGAPSYS
jgi:hypothetical protein